MTCKSSTPLKAFTILSLSLGLVSGVIAAEPLQVRTYQSPDGAQYFAASIEPIEAAAQQPSDIVLLVDTSASQTGMYRDTALAAVESYLESLNTADRVCVIAADLEARALTRGFVQAGEEATKSAVVSLQNEAPLGSTDLEAAFGSALKTLSESSNRQRAIVFIGDGLSTAKVVGSGLNELVAKLRGARVAVTSYAIGPHRDNDLLAALANQTGGNLYIDGTMTWADEARGISSDRATQENLSRGARIGRLLADWTHASVVWPTNLSAGEGIEVLAPANIPPLRSDRDTILIGKATTNGQSIAFQAEIDGNTVQWAGQLGQSDEANAFLAELVKRSGQDGGVSLTTLGSIGLEETGRVILAEIDQLTALAERAASLGDKQGAARISQAVLRRDPGNLRARTVQFFGEGEESNTQQGEGLELVRPAEQLVAPPAGEVIDDGSYPPAEVVVDGRFLNSVQRNSSVYAQMLEKEVQNAVADARDIMSQDPAGATQQLKFMLLNVERAPELVASVRAGLVDKIQSALREAARQAEIKDDLDREREARLAAIREQRLLLDRLELKRERQKQLFERINSLVDERRYAESQEVAAIAEELDPEGVEPRVARVWTEAKRYHEFNQQLRKERAAGFINAMSQVEKISCSIP